MKESINLINYQKAGEILGYKGSSGSVYDALKPLESIRVNGVKHWLRADVEALAATRKATTARAPRYDDGVEARLARIEANVDQLFKWTDRLVYELLDRSKGDA